MHRNTTRFAAIALFAGVTATSAQADLTLPTNFLVANSVQTFTDDDLAGLDLVNMVIEARGTAYVAKPGTPGESNGTVTPRAIGFPITKVVIGSNLKIVSGTASGAALYFNRTDLDTGKKTGLTLANFTIDYKNAKVLADTTILGGKTQVQMPLYDFTATSPLALKYKFPLSISLHEVLGNLRLTAQGKAALTNGVELPEFAIPVLDIDYGTLTQDINVQFRARAINPRPYVAK